MAIDFDDLDNILMLLKDAQEADFDMREEVREQRHFIHKKDGQWEPDIIKITDSERRPRYTFDKTSPIIDQIAGEMNNADFTLRVSPASGEASKDNAKIFDGLIRNIRNISNAENIFNTSGRVMVESGMDGWEVVQDWVDADAFDQDLFIRKVHNWVDRVWFDPNSEEQDHSDAVWVIVLSVISIKDFEDQFSNDKNPKKPISIGDDRRANVYTHKPNDTVTIAKILYKKERDIELVRMNNGAVYEDNEKFQSIKDELAQSGITIELDNDGVEKRRTRKGWRVHSRLFSGDDFLTKEEETVFDFLPVCATYGNFTVSENKRITSGVTRKLMDPQRVLNYAGSKDIEEGALRPRDKLMMTSEQAAGHTKTLETMNINADPAQLYNHVEMQPPPFMLNAARANPGLQTTIANMGENINSIAGMFAANMGDNPGLQSGIAIDRQISKGDNSTTKWFDAQEVAICYTGKVLVNAIPRVYDSTRQVRILSEDGTFEMQDINAKVFDNESQSIVEINNLAAGTYDVVCERGLAFKSRQREAAAAFAEIAAINPDVMQLAQDIWFKNQDAPGMDIVASRARAFMLANGTIPQDEWTDEELAQAQAAEEQAAQQPEQPVGSDNPDDDFV